MIDTTQLKIGLEIHVELATRTKMFTRVANPAHPDHHDAAPNTLTDPVVLGLPGALPVMNRRAVEMSMRVGLALDCTIAPFSVWDRKSYFYPDLPKGYQISQYELPLCSDGVLEIEGDDGEAKRIGIIRAHLEEDAGKLGHELPGGGHYDGSLVDLNRAGTPLLEIVTQPDLTSAADAVVFARALRELCIYLGVTEGVMQRGHMRFEPNINVIIRTDDGREHATPVVEIKNLNSFRSLEGAINHERARQIEAWQNDGLVHGPGMKATHGWDDERGVTFLQRSKEDAQDYRYFPEPDLVPVTVSPGWCEEIRVSQPELPSVKRRRYASDFALGEKDIDALLESRRTCLFFEDCAGALRALDEGAVSDSAAGHLCAKFLLNTGARLANEREHDLDELGITPEQVARLIALREAGDVGSSAGDRLFSLLCETDDDPRTVAEREGLLQVSDSGALDSWIDAALEAQAQAASDFLAGKDAALGRLIGEVMKQSAAQADAAAVRARLIERRAE